MKCAHSVGVNGPGGCSAGTRKKRRHGKFWDGARIPKAVPRMAPPGCSRRGFLRPNVGTSGGLSCAGEQGLGYPSDSKPDWTEIQNRWSAPGAAKKPAEPGWCRPGRKVSLMGRRVCGGAGVEMACPASLDG